MSAPAMHQAIATPPLAVPPKKRRSRRKRYIIFGSLGLVLLLIIGSIISGKRENQSRW